MMVASPSATITSMVVTRFRTVYFLPLLLAFIRRISGSINGFCCQLQFHKSCTSCFGISRIANSAIKVVIVLSTKFSPILMHKAPIKYPAPSDVNNAFAVSCTSANCGPSSSSHWNIIPMPPLIIARIRISNSAMRFFLYFLSLENHPTQIAIHTLIITK